MKETLSTITVADVAKAIDGGQSLEHLSKEQLLDAIKLIRWYSIAQGVKRVCDTHNGRADEAKTRIAKTRYHRLATTLAGDSLEMIVDGSYSDADEIGGYYIKA